MEDKEHEKQAIQAVLTNIRFLRNLYIKWLEQSDGFAPYYVERLRGRVLELQKDELRFMEWLSQI